MARVTAIEAIEQLRAWANDFAKQHNDIINALEGILDGFNKLERRVAALEKDLNEII